MSLFEPARGVARALCHHVRQFMSNDARNRTGEDPLAFGSGLIAKISMEHLPNAITVHIHKGLDLAINHWHPPEGAASFTLAVTRGGHSAIAMKNDLVALSKLHAFLEFVALQQPQGSSEQLWRFRAPKLGFQNWPKSAECAGREVHQNERVVGNHGVGLRKNGAYAEPGQKKSSQSGPARVELKRCAKAGKSAHSASLRSICVSVQ